jgi:hypothetical protein
MKEATFAPLNVLEGRVGGAGTRLVAVQAIFGYTMLYLFVAVTAPVPLTVQPMAILALMAVWPGLAFSPTNILPTLQSADNVLKHHN